MMEKLKYISIRSLKSLAMLEYSNIRQLIVNGKIREAMGALKEMSKGSIYYEEILRFYARNTEIEDKLRQALISREEAITDKYDIRRALLSLLNKLEGH